MEGGSHAASGRTKISKGKGVARVPEEFWNLSGRREKNRIGARKAVRELLAARLWSPEQFSRCAEERPLCPCCSI